MTIKDALGEERYETIRETLKRAFPDPKNDVTDELVDAFIREIQHKALPGLEKLGLPAPRGAEQEEPRATATYPLYVAHATHARTLAMDSTKPFNSAFTGYLPVVRVPLPVAIDETNQTVATAIGTVDFSRDHLAGSVNLISALYGAELGYTPARVDLITPARKLGARFAAVAIYLGYRGVSDPSPSFYVLEAGLATGQAAMLYLGTTMDGTIVKQTGYLPTPFSSPNNTYTGSLIVQNDQPIQLVIQANAPGLPHYIQVTVDYESVGTAPSGLPIELTIEAVERVAAIGKKMGVPVGMPTLVEDILAEIGLHFLTWIEKPGSKSAAPETAATETAASEPAAPGAQGSAPTPEGEVRGSPQSPLVQRLLSLAREIVKNFQLTGPDRGVSSVSGQRVQLSKAVRDDLERLLGDVQRGNEPVPAHRLAEAFGQLDVQRGSPDVFSLPNGASVVAAIRALALGAGADGSTTGNGTRQTWANQLANQAVQPLSILRPVSLNSASDPASIQTILLNALKNGCAVKAAGSGHSYSDVATTPDFFIDTHGLGQISSAETPITGQLSASELRSTLPLAIAPITWPSYDPENNHALIEVEAGITIRNLNTALEGRNLGLMNMGGYDGQTIVGAISTSTHGSGIKLGPFPDMVRSLVLATTGRWGGKTVGGSDPGNGVYYYRIEPRDGITDPTKYSDPLIQLIQDDDCFASAICNMGCFGVIYSVVLEVMQMYWLTETRYLTTLDKVMADLAPDPANEGSLPSVLTSTRNYEVLIQPYPMRGFSVVDMDPSEPPSTYYKYFLCLVTERNISPPGGSGAGHRPTPDWLGRILSLLLNIEPWFTPEAIDISLLTLIDYEFVAKSYQIYNLGLGGGVGFAAEIGFSLDDHGAYTAQNFTNAIDRIHMIAQRALDQGKQYQTSAFSLRFVQGSSAHLSMMQGRNTAMIEMDMLTGTYGGAEIMYRYETSMYSLGGRPHWGLEFDSLNGSNGLLQQMYPKLDRWMTVYRQFNAQGTFNNAFTQRMGFTILT